VADTTTPFPPIAWVCQSGLDWIMVPDHPDAEADALRLASNRSAKVAKALGYIAHRVQLVACPAAGSHQQSPFSET